MGAGAMWTIDDIRREIEALVDTASFQKPDYYRAFTKRLKEILGDFKVVKGDDTIRTVDLIYANPERAVAKIEEGKNITLPIMSLQFDGIELDNARRKPMEALVEKKFWDSQKRRAIRYMALAPVATNLVFGLNLWGRYVEEVNQLTEQVLLKFRPNLPIDIREGEVYQAFVRDVAEATQLTAGDREDRIVKRVVRFEVQSYVPSQVFRFTNTGQIETLNYEVYLEEIETLVPLEQYLAGGGTGG